MKCSLVVRLLVLTMCGLSLGSSSPLAQSRAKAENVPVIPHQAVANFFKNPAGIYTGENMGIATNSKGNVYIYHRAYETRLFELPRHRVSSCVRLGETITASRLRIQCVSMRRTISGLSTKAPTCSSSSVPKAKCS